MPSPDLVARGAHTLAVCNACRYCEQYCPVFPAMERRTSFGAGDLSLLANLCHNCGECLYACQYAPPHAFGVDVPRMFAELRLASYEEHCWPRPLARAFRRQGSRTAVAIVAGLLTFMSGTTFWLNPGVLTTPPAGADFYAVMPHGVMVGLFGSVGLFVLAAFAVSLRAYGRAIGGIRQGGSWAAVAGAVVDGVSLRHLHGGGTDCVTAEEVRRPWRRWSHHATLGGFAFCFASTSVAAAYHALGWEAPYAYTSVPVLLGVVGGLGLVAGPTGQWWERRRRDPALADPDQHGMDSALLLLLWLTSVTGLLLLARREGPAMPWLLLVHLASVLALFVSLPYGKFVHGLYRLAALTADAAERETQDKRKPRAPGSSPAA
jgi:citrate/tricarballylate utilization protein